MLFIVFASQTLKFRNDVEIHSGHQLVEASCIDAVLKISRKLFNIFICLFEVTIANLLAFWNISYGSFANDVRDFTYWDAV